MSRRPASYWLAAVLVTGCGGGPKEAPAPQAAPATAAEPSPTPTAAAAQVVASNTQPSPSPSPAPAAASLVHVDPPPPEPAPLPDPNAKPTPKPVDPLQWLQDGEARKADYQRRMKETEASLAVANASVADWQRTILEFKNPLLPRPKLSPEDSQAIASMDGVQRVHWAEGRLEEARTARDAAQKTLDDLKANPPTN